MRRPDDLEELVKKAVTDGNSLTDFEKKIVTAFTIRDENNQIVMNPESPDMPVINDAEYMLTICSIDLAKWEVITRELEVLSHRPSLMNRLKDAKLMNIVSRIFNKPKNILRSVRLNLAMCKTKCRNKQIRTIIKTG